MSTLGKQLQKLLGLIELNQKKGKVLDPKEQIKGTFLGAAICLEIVFSALLLHQLLCAYWGVQENIPAWYYISISGLGGFLGGSTRALIRLIIELNNKKVNPKYYLSRWFLYLIKSFIGIGAGISFFITVNLGLVNLLSDSKTINIYGVILSAFIGGMFFENVFKLLENMFKKDL